MFYIDVFCTKIGLPSHTSTACIARFVYILIFMSNVLTQTSSRLEYYVIAGPLETCHVALVTHLSRGLWVIPFFYFPTGNSNSLPNIE